MKRILFMALLTIQIIACRSPGVRCDGHLSPINAPAKAVSAVSEPAHPLKKVSP